MAPNAALLPLHEHLRRHARATPDRTAYLWYGVIEQTGDIFGDGVNIAARLGPRSGPRSSRKASTVLRFWSRRAEWSMVLPSAEKRVEKGG